MLRFAEASQTFVFTGVEEKPVPSILRNFSAPVRLTTDLTQEDLIFLMANDADAFNRWEAGQTLTRSLLVGLVHDAAKGVELKMDPAIVEAMRSIVSGAVNPGADKAFIARAMVIPSESELSEMVSPADPDVIHAARKFVVTTLAAKLRGELEAAVVANTAASYSNEPEPRAERSLKNTCLGMLSYLEDPAVGKRGHAHFASREIFIYLFDDTFLHPHNTCSYDNMFLFLFFSLFHLQWTVHPLSRFFFCPSLCLYLFSWCIFIRRSLVHFICRSSLSTRARASTTFLRWDTTRRWTLTR